MTSCKTVSCSRRNLLHGVVVVLAVVVVIVVVVVVVVVVVKVKQSRYRPGVAQRKLRFSDFMTKAQDGGKFVSLTHRPPLPLGNTRKYSFMLEAESTTGPYCDRKDYVIEKLE